MGSSNKHWPSLFKSSRSNQRHQDDNNNNNKAPVVEERTPEPKPRWNPKPEQIRILESIFNSGMVNPTREEIRRIRLRLEEYGDVGDANVFYWFQNRKSRSKNKKRQAQAAAEAEAEAEAEDEAEPELEAEQNPYPPPPVNTFLGQYSSSSSSSDNSADHMGLPFFTNSPTASVNQQAFYQSTPNDFLVDPLFYSNAASAPGFYIPDASSNLTIGNGGINLDPQLGFASFPPTTTTTTVTNSHSLLPPPSTTVPSTLYHFQGLGGMQKVNVFINDMEFEVDAGPFNVKETFGDDAVLVHSSGHVVITNEWGVTLHPLQNGAFYYLIMM